MFVLDELSRSQSALSIVRKPYERYSSSGEINTQVDPAREVIERVASAYADADAGPARRPHRRLGDWWFNLRPSNTEPLLRLNLEAPDRNECDQRVVDVLALITSG
jgi:phosphomannomutase